MGRKETEINWQVVDGALAVGANASQVIYALEHAGIKTCTKTLSNMIAKYHNMTFTEYREYKMGGTKIKLLQKAIQLAIQGNVTMLIFCLKNMCGWSDKVENKIEEVPTKELVQQAKDIIASYEKQQNEKSEHTSVN